MAAFDSKQLTQDIEVLERNIKQLDGKYSDYFDGVTSKEPKELRAQAEAIVRKWWGRPISNTMQRFQINNLIQRFRTYQERWDRLLRAKAKAEREDVDVTD